jgi:TolB protein
MPSGESYDLLDVESIKERLRNNRKNILIVIGIVSVVLIVVTGIIILGMIYWRSNGRKIPPKVNESLYLANIQQITNSGINAEAYWSFDGTKLVFQAIRQGYPNCDQIFVMNADGTNVKLASDGRGRTTCSFFINETHILYGSTMDTLGKGCPPSPDSSFGYVWPVYKTMDIYMANWQTGEVVKKLTDTQGYNAEATLSPDGSKIVFTSARDGDLELYSMDVDGSNLKRLTYSPGYDGGAFFSHDGKKIVWRANRPRGQALTDYLNLLNLGLVAPVATDMEIYIMDADGQNQRQITKLGGANFAPAFLPDDSGIIFSSNMNLGFNFHLYTIDLNGKNLKQITSEGTFNCFPMFSPDGKYLAFESNRGARSPHEMNVLIAEWIPQK